MRCTEVETLRLRGDEKNSHIEKKLEAESCGRVTGHTEKGGDAKARLILVSGSPGRHSAHAVKVPGKQARLMAQDQTAPLPSHC